MDDAYSVRQTVAYIKKLLTNDAILYDVYVSGEVSNLKTYPSGHVYFTLKDEYAALNCVMFAQYAAGVAFQNGVLTAARGCVSVYEKTGQMQFYVQEVKFSGTGAFYESFEELKKKLSAEGLFDAKRKKEIPRFAKRVAVITSPAGAVVFDIIKIIKKRNPTVKITVVPALVQGEDAPSSLCAALAAVIDRALADCVIIGRGGGSGEDLNAFNSETLARAIARSPIPVISAVGHETDFTIADFAADMRAPTPSAAAAAVSFDYADICSKTAYLQKKAKHILLQRLDAARTLKKALLSRRVIKNPEEAVYNRKAYVESLCKTARMAFSHKTDALKNRLSLASNAVNNLSPKKTLERGFALVVNGDGRIVKNESDFLIGGEINIYINDGLLKAEAASYERGKKIFV